MNQEKLNDYLNSVRSLSIRVNESDEAQQDLWNLIQNFKENSFADPSYENFFKGEDFFYRKKYDTSLKYYLKAQGVANFNFFCYRASAYLFDQLDRPQKVLDFINKALAIFPEDFLTLQLLKKYSQQEDNSLKELSEARTQPFDESQMEELAHIFEERHRSEELFAEERPSSSYRLTNMEIPMNTDSDIFSSPKSLESGNTQHLTERLYARRKEGQEEDPFAGKALESNTLAFEELKRMASSGPMVEKEHFSHFMATELGIDLGVGEALEQRIKAFQSLQSELTNHYLQQGKSRTKNPDYCLYYLNGWPRSTSGKHVPFDPFFLTEQSRRTSGGIFLRWNGKGIVINPGRRFLKNFHDQGLYIRDIDFVIVTDERAESHTDVKEIYDLNYQLNKVSQQLHIIHYYFSHKAFQDLSRVLKPNFKQEQHILHCLEIFVDSPDVERVELCDGISLNYFQTAQRDYAPGREFKEERKNPSVVGIRLDLKTPPAQSQEKSSVRIGYVGHSCWNPLLAHHLGSCDLLMTGFGHTTPNDYNKISYPQDCLGYYGNYTLLEEVAPKLLLIGEYSGREGDIRLEVSQKIRNEWVSRTGLGNKKSPSVLPADTGLFLCLKSLKIHCPVTNTWVDPAQIRVIKTSDSFGQLRYLSPSCCYQI